MFETIAAESRTLGARRLLLDISTVSGDLPDLDRYHMGKRAAEAFTHIDRLAALRSPELRFTGFALEVAQNRGLQARAFLERAEAERWLTSD